MLTTIRSADGSTDTTIHYGADDASSQTSDFINDDIWLNEPPPWSLSYRVIRPFPDASAPRVGNYFTCMACSRASARSAKYEVTIYRGLSHIKVCNLCAACFVDLRVERHQATFFEPNPPQPLYWNIYGYARCSMAGRDCNVCN